MNEVKIFKTECRKEREKRDFAIYNEFKELTSVKGQSKVLVTKYLMKKYGVHSISTIYVIRNKFEKGNKKNKKTN